MISFPSPRQRDEATTIAANLRRLMTRNSMSLDDVIEGSGLDERTVRSILRSAGHPHARTLHKLAQGLGVDSDELFRPLENSSPRQFDRATNSLVETVVAGHPALFENWSEAHFDELYSRFGAGGQLTEPGVLATAEAMNAKRDLLNQIGIILESGEAELLAEFVRLLHRRVTECKPKTE